MNLRRWIRGNPSVCTEVDPIYRFKITDQSGRGKSKLTLAASYIHNVFTRPETGRTEYFPWLKDTFTREVTMYVL